MLKIKIAKKVYLFYTTLLVTLIIAISLSIVLTLNNSKKFITKNDAEEIALEYATSNNRINFRHVDYEISNISVTETHNEDDGVYDVEVSGYILNLAQYPLLELTVDNNKKIHIIFNWDTNLKGIGDIVSAPLINNNNISSKLNITNSAIFIGNKSISDISYISGNTNSENSISTYFYYNNQTGELYNTDAASRNILFTKENYGVNSFVDSSTELQDLGFTKILNNGIYLSNSDENYIFLVWNPNTPQYLYFLFSHIINVGTNVIEWRGLYYSSINTINKNYGNINIYYSNK